MKNSLIIVCFFIFGVVIGLFGKLPAHVAQSDISTYVLYLLMFLVGISIGGDGTVFSVLRKVNFRILLVPLSVVAGSLAGAALASLIIYDIPVRDAMAVGSGFGYYSLSSIYITELRGETLGTIALLSNIMREIFTLIAAPLLVRYFGRTAPIAAGGATAMDTTLPVITLYSGREYAIFAVFSGIVLTIAVPVLITVILG